MYMREYNNKYCCQLRQFLMTQEMSEYFRASIIYDDKICGNFTYFSGLGSVVGIATGYGLDGTGIQSRWGRDFPHLSRPAQGPTQPPVQWVPGLYRGKERPGREADPSTPPSALVKKEKNCRVQLKRDDTRWRTGREVKEKLSNGVGSQYASHYLGRWCIQHYYCWCAHLGCH
jgi:hypothetical protein